MARGDLGFPAANDQKPAARLENDLAGFGFYLAGGDLPVQEEFYLWPENCAIWELWLSVQTQWHTANGIRTGLNYPGVQVCLNYHPAGKKRLQVFRTLQAMEFAALDEWAKQRDR